MAREAEQLMTGTQRSCRWFVGVDPIPQHPAPRHIVKWTLRRVPTRTLRDEAYLRHVRFGEPEAGKDCQRVVLEVIKSYGKGWSRGRTPGMFASLHQSRLEPWRARPYQFDGCRGYGLHGRNE